MGEEDQESLVPSPVFHASHQRTNSVQIDISSRSLLQPCLEEGWFFSYGSGRKQVTHANRYTNEGTRAEARAG